MALRLEYLLPDETTVRVIYYGLAAALPDAASVPLGSFYFAYDTNDLRFTNGAVWVPAVARTLPGNATTTTPGLVSLLRAAGGAHPLALTVPDGGVADGVALTDAGAAALGMPPPASTDIGGVRIGVGLETDVDGVLAVTPGGIGAYGVELDDTPVGTEPALDFIDGTGAGWDVADDSGGTRTTVSLSTDPVSSIIQATLGSNLTIVHGADRSVLSVTLTPGNWMIFVRGQANLAATTSQTRVFLKGPDGGTYGGLYRVWLGTVSVYVGPHYPVHIVSDIIPVEISEVITLYANFGADGVMQATTSVSGLPGATTLIAVKIGAFDPTGLAEADDDGDTLFDSDFITLAEGA